MAYRANPFLERMSERSTSDQEFARLFAPSILERLADDAFEGGMHVFRSPPGGGKTTLLRAFTPMALRAFWNARRSSDMSETYQRLVQREILDEHEGPRLLGVMLTCASGYADLPPGGALSQEGLFRALFDCRVVLRTLRDLALLLGAASPEQLSGVHLSYGEETRDLSSIPRTDSPQELLRWAEQRERAVYASMDGRKGGVLPPHARFEGLLWLSGVRFVAGGRSVAPKRLLMIDDVQTLRRKQREQFIRELTEARARLPVWLAERSVALGDELLSPGVREGRDLREYSLEQIWTAKPHQFCAFAENVLDRRLETQNVIPAGGFAQHLSSEVNVDDIRKELERGCKSLAEELDRYRGKARYSTWVAHAEVLLAERSLESLRELYVTRTLLLRDEAKRQHTLNLEPLPVEELEQRDSSAVQGAASMFMREELNVPYYFGLQQLCVMATSNVEELLFLAAALYDGMKAKQVLRRTDSVLSSREQEDVLLGAARRKRDFIPKGHTEGRRAQRLLDSIGAYCRERTFLPNAPYAPGVTGVRLSDMEFEKLKNELARGTEHIAALRRVLAECVAENLLVTRASAASATRRAGTVYYLNRTLCVYYGLPLQMGGWQDVTITELSVWMERGRLAQQKLAEL